MIMSPQERAERRRKLRRARNIRRAAFLLLLVSILAAIAIARIVEKPEQAQEAEIIKAAITVPATTPEPEAEITEQPETPEETPEPVVIEQETPAAPEPSRYDSVEISEEDIYTLACLVYHEARGEPFEGQVAVIEVVLNRCFSANSVQFATLPEKVEAAKFLTEIGAATLDQILTMFDLPTIGGEEGARRVQTLNMVNAALADKYQTGKETEPTQEPTQEPTEGNDPPDGGE